MSNNMVWIGELDRFGYTLTAVGKTEEEVAKALMDAYENAYRDMNDNADPRDEFWSDGSSYYDTAREELYIRAMSFGEVVWC